MDSPNERARSFLAGEALSFVEADALWRSLRDHDEPSLARSVLSRLRESDHDSTILLDSLPAARAVRRELCQQEAMLTSKDEELGAAVRHGRAIEVLVKDFGELDDPDLQDSETLGIAAGIFKRKWFDLGQLSDLQASAALYERGAHGPPGDDAYPHINAAFLEDVLAELGDEPVARHARAVAIRERIVADLPQSDTWWNAASRAEACFGLRRYEDATAAIQCRTTSLTRVSSSMRCNWRGAVSV